MEVVRIRDLLAAEQALDDARAKTSAEIVDREVEAAAKHLSDLQRQFAKGTVNTITRQ